MIKRYSFCKKASTFIAWLVLILAPMLSVASKEHSHIAIGLESPARVSAGSYEIRFELIDRANGTKLTPVNLSLTHENKLHLLAYDPGLKEFRHVHPEFDGKFWTTDLDLFVDGDYFIWVQGEISIRSEEFSVLTRIHVYGGAPEWPAPTLSDIRIGENLGSVSTLSNTVLREGKMAMLKLTFTKADGSDGDIAPYLGAFAHVIAVSEDGGSLIHVHPMDGKKPNEGMLHVTFPNKGFYRLWVQFIDGGILKTVSLSVEVGR